MKRIGVTFSDRQKAEPYLRAIELAGAEPVPIAPGAPRALDGLDALLLTGGTDVNPARYSQEPHEALEPPDDARDEMEASLLNEALERDLPTLAICRGMQLFNVAHGGTLIQHLDNAERHVVRSSNPGEPVHDVRVVEGTKLAEILGEGDHPVNSRHHQAIAALGEGLKVSALSRDGVIEALERPDRKFAVAVQWHPEDQVSSDAVQRRLFEALIAALY